jgi:hypothetical protein
MRQFQGSLGPIQDLQPKHLPGLSDHQKNEADSQCEIRASGPKDESTYLDRIARTRRLYFVLAVGWAFVYVGVELLKGLFS